MYFVSSGLRLIVWLVIDCCGLGLIVLVCLFFIGCVYCVVLFCAVFTMVLAFKFGGLCFSV